jgi:hypothetical protein
LSAWAVHAAAPTNHVEESNETHPPCPRHYTVKTTPQFSALKAQITEDSRVESLKTARMEVAPQR